ncbi:MAG: prepilin-type N-terminal cleavage/methylation domain-containing protein [Dissulfurimicrobium sp.]|uniref:prepilin-type N-terminal cleavage/methylation domain-containing protein n=1 Tax=Dissulfurimicrobium sp. TaxID=2022436 RepID=UPI00404AEA72
MSHSNRLNTTSISSHVRLRAGKGFTLVELLIVLLLVGSISAMVFIAVGSGILKSKESRFISNFTQTLVHARSASLVRGETVRFVIYGPEREFFVQGKRPEHIPETIKVEGSGINELRPGVYVVYFFPDGSSSGGEIDLKRQDGSIDRISIDRFLGIIQTTHIS